MSNDVCWCASPVHHITNYKFSSGKRPASIELVDKITPNNDPDVFVLSTLLNDQTYWGYWIFGRVLKVVWCSICSFNKASNAHVCSPQQGKQILTAAEGGGRGASHSEIVILSYNFFLISVELNSINNKRFPIVWWWRMFCCLLEWIYWRKSHIYIVWCINRSS